MNFGWILREKFVKNCKNPRGSSWTEPRNYRASFFTILYGSCRALSHESKELKNTNFGCGLREKTAKTQAAYHGLFFTIYWSGTALIHDFLDRSYAHEALLCFWAGTAFKGHENKARKEL